MLEYSQKNILKALKLLSDNNFHWLEMGYSEQGLLFNVTTEMSIQYPLSVINGYTIKVETPDFYVLEFDCDNKKLTDLDLNPFMLRFLLVNKVNGLKFISFLDKQGKNLTEE